MPMRLQEVHPSLVHFPITLLPLAIGADLLARATGNRTLRDIGRVGIALGAASAALAGLAGLAAQEEVNVEEGSEAYDQLVTHRNINLTLVAASAAMASWRWGEREASPVYLALGLGALGAMGFSAYLGGKMVYEHGLGVVAADGLYEAEHPVPELTRATAGQALKYAAQDIVEGARSAAEQIGHGEIVPAIVGDRRPDGQEAKGSGDGAAKSAGGARARPASDEAEAR